MITRIKKYIKIKYPGLNPFIGKIIYNLKGRPNRPLFYLHPKKNLYEPVIYLDQAVGDEYAINESKKRIENFNQDELIKYQELFRIIETTKILSKVSLGKEDTILDVGCDIGQWSNIFIKLFGTDINYIGLAIDPTTVDHLNHFSKNDKIKFISGDACKISLPSESADLVLLSSVLQYVPDWDLALSEFYRVSKKYVLICALSIFKHNPTIEVFQSGETKVLIYNYAEALKKFEKHGFNLIAWDYSSDISSVESIKEPVINCHFLLEKTHVDKKILAK